MKNNFYILSFSDVFTDVTRHAKKIPVTNYLSDGVYPIFDQSKKYISGYYNQDSDVFFDVPAIIFGDHTRIRKYVDVPCFIGADGVKLLKGKIESNPKYLFYALSSINIPNTGYNRHFKLLKEAFLKIRPIEIQNKIVKELDLINIIKNRKLQQLAKLDELAKSRFIEMFGDLKSSKKIIDFIDNNIVSSKRNYNENSTIKYIDISSIDNESFSIVGTTEYCFKDAPSRAQQCVREGDILISTVRPNLKNIAAVKSKERNLVASSGFCVLRAKDCPMEFLFGVISSDDFTNTMTLFTTGANYPAIKDSDVLNYPIPDASYDDMKSFANFVQQLDKSKFRIKKSLEKLELTYKSLLQEYFG